MPKWIIVRSLEHNIVSHWLLGFTLFYICRKKSTFRTSLTKQGFDTKFIAFLSYIWIISWISRDPSLPGKPLMFCSYKYTFMVFLIKLVGRLKCWNYTLKKYKLVTEGRTKKNKHWQTLEPEILMHG